MKKAELLSAIEKVVTSAGMTDTDDDNTDSVPYDSNKLTGEQILQLKAMEMELKQQDSDMQLQMQKQQAEMQMQQAEVHLELKNKLKLI